MERLAAGYEDVLWAVVVERLPGESAIESFQPQARDLGKPESVDERIGDVLILGRVVGAIAEHLRAAAREDP